MLRKSTSGKRRLNEEKWQRSPDLSLGLQERISLHVVVDEEIDDQLKAQMKRISWSVLDATEESIQIEVTFTYPQVYGQDKTSKERIELKARFDFILIAIFTEKFM